MLLFLRRFYNKNSLYFYPFFIISSCSREILFETKSFQFFFEEIFVCLFSVFAGLANVLQHFYGCRALQLVLFAACHFSALFVVFRTIPLFHAGVILKMFVV